ncbi:hypothetical protein DFH09DRAFT_1020997 [Mycena vulgaris]|nr:hypothetical protein DFH09DRAFT_1020997 [Mycena vulgaris]
MLRAAAAGRSRRGFSLTALRAWDSPSFVRDPPPHAPTLKPVRGYPKAVASSLLTPSQWAAIEPTVLTVFHNPADATSTSVLAGLDSAAFLYPKQPPRKARRPYIPRGPLEIDIAVLSRPPDADEFREIASHLSDAPGARASFAAFLRPKTSHWPTSAEALVALVETEPTLLAWPVVVDWEHRQSSIGAGYMNLVKAAAVRRSVVLKSKKEPPPPLEWIDYDY